jgi:hypothetical protein
MGRGLHGVRVEHDSALTRHGTRVPSSMPPRFPEQVSRIRADRYVVGHAEKVAVVASKVLDSAGFVVIRRIDAKHGAHGLVPPTGIEPVSGA